MRQKNLIIQQSMCFLINFLLIPKQVLVIKNLKDISLKPKLINVKIFLLGFFIISIQQNVNDLSYQLGTMIKPTTQLVLTRLLNVFLLYTTINPSVSQMIPTSCIIKWIENGLCIRPPNLRSRKKPNLKLCDLQMGLKKIYQIHCSGQSYILST